MTKTGNPTRHWDSVPLSLHGYDPTQNLGRFDRLIEGFIGIASSQKDRNGTGGPVSLNLLNAMGNHPVISDVEQDLVATQIQGRDGFGNQDLPVHNGGLHTVPFGLKADIVASAEKLAEQTGEIGAVECIHAIEPPGEPDP